MKGAVKQEVRRDLDGKGATGEERTELVQGGNRDESGKQTKYMGRPDAGFLSQEEKGAAIKNFF